MLTLSNVLFMLQSILGGGTQDPFDAPQRKPYKVHDHVKIVVNDKSRASTRADLRTDKRTRWETDFEDFVRFDVSSRGHRRLRAAELADDPAIDIDARFRQDNIGKTGREFLLSFTITAEVIEVMPNGNLVLQAKRNRKVNNEFETIRLTGVVAAASVKENNVVHSDDIADLNLSYEGSGSVSDSQKPGILGWLISKLWPF